MRKLKNMPSIDSADCDINLPDILVTAETGLNFVKINSRNLSKTELAALSKILGSDLPQTPNRIIGDALRMAWLAPGKWLLTGPESLVAKKTSALVKQLSGKTVLVTDLTHGLTAYVVTGQSARAVLSSLCPLDLHPRVFGENQCARTLLGGTGAFIHSIEDGFRVIVDQSICDSTHRLFLLASEAYSIDKI